MRLHLILIILLSISSLNGYNQRTRDIERQIVLSHNKIGKTFVFDRSPKGYTNRTEITYLGRLITNDGRVFKALTYIYLFGLSPDANSKFILFNDRNQYLGYYYVGGITDLPSKIVNNALVFDNRENPNCDKTIITKISFAKGIPKEFFKECKNKMGDIYTFGYDE